MVGASFMPPTFEYRTPNCKGAVTSVDYNNKDDNTHKREA